MKGPQFIDVAGRRLRHRITGEGGDAVVMLHGFGGSLDTWSANQDPLAAEGWTVASLDLPGHGESSLDVGSGSLDELAAVVLDYLDAVGIRRAHFVGHSMGAALSLVIADGMPSRVQSLVLIGPAGIGQKINAFQIQLHKITPLVIEANHLKRECACGLEERHIAQGDAPF